MNSWTPETCGTLLEAAHDTLRPGGLDLTEHLLNFGNFTAGSRILDAGCGTGATLHYLDQVLQTAAVGVDCSSDMLAAARSRFSEVKLVCAAVENLPFCNASFDGVVCECVLSQTSIGKSLAEFYRVLRPEGVLLVSDLYRRQTGLGIEADLPPDDDLPTAKQEETMLTNAGFTIEHWQDRTRDLKRLAVRLIMAPGALAENLSGWCGQGSVVNGTGTCTGDRALGYHLLVARKTAR